MVANMISELRLINEKSVDSDSNVFLSYKNTELVTVDNNDPDLVWKELKENI